MNTYTKLDNKTKISSPYPEPFTLISKKINLQVSKQNRAYEKAQKEYIRKRSSLLTKGDLELGATIIQKERQRYNLEVLDAKGDISRIIKIREHTKGKIKRLLKKNISNASKIYKLDKEYNTNQRKLLKLQSNLLRNNNINASLGAALPGTLDYDIFEPPFELSNTGEDWRDFFLNNYTDEYINFNQSFIDANSGFLALDFNFDLEDTFFSLPDFDLYRIIISTGVNYTVPRTGFLNVSAIVQSVSNRVQMSVEDNFGFSSADIFYKHGLGILFVYSGKYTYYPRYLIDDGLTSFGSDISYTLPPLQKNDPYILNITPSSPFQAGENVQIRVMSFLFFSVESKNMSANVLTKLFWQVKRLYVTVE